MKRETFDWGSSKREQDAALQTAKMWEYDLRCRETVKTDSVHVWHNPALRCYQVEWETT